MSESKTMPLAWPQRTELAQHKQAVAWKPVSNKKKSQRKARETAQKRLEHNASCREDAQVANSRTMRPTKKDKNNSEQKAEGKTEQNYGGGGMYEKRINLMFTMRNLKRDIRARIPAARTKPRRHSYGSTPTSTIALQGG